MTDDQRLHEAKADYGSIYVAPDPRPYYGTLSGVDYVIPGESAPLIDRALAASPLDNGLERPVLDIGCSYGINATILRTDQPFEAVIAHYTDPSLADADTAAMTTADRGFLARHGRAADRVIRGLDSSQPAIAYAVGAGLLDAGWAEDLETTDPSAELAKGISDTEMIISTGAIGYVTERTYGRVLECLEYPERTWLLSVVLRAFSFEPIAEVCRGYGLVTEPVPGPMLRQRRFASDDEREATLHDVHARGLSTDGLESTGWVHAQAWLTRPADDVAAQPIETLFDR